MSRPLTGTKKRTASGWQASLPRHRGANARVTNTFTTEAAADRWLADGRAAITAGEEPPRPDTAQLAGPARAAVGTAFMPLFTAWRTEHYCELRRGGPSREATVAGHGDRIDAFMRKNDLSMEQMTRAQVKALQASLTRTLAAAAAAAVVTPDGLDPEALVTMNQAVELPGMAKRATLKRRIKDGALAAAETSPTGHRYRVGDLYSQAVLGPTGKLRRGPRRTGSLSQDVANDVMWVFEQVCLFALDQDVKVPQDRQSLKMHLTDRPESPDRVPVALGTCAQIAAGLHVVHQLALWLMRILGLRIGEAFGILVDDVEDLGPDQPGIVTIRAQGGRQYATRGTDGTVLETDRIERTKNRSSRRVLVVPPALMTPIRVTIAVFHTESDGTVRTGARLIPGLQRRDEAGQHSFREALAAASAARGIDCTPDEEAVDLVFSCTPHDMRRTLLSDLDRLEVKDSHAQRQAGHRTGTSVLNRHYQLDDPKLRPVREIARRIEDEVGAELPAGLLIPTMVTCTSANQPALEQDGRRIDAELAERGWFVTATHRGSGDPLLTADEVATMLGVTVKTARAWMAEGFVPSIVWAERARGAERCSRYRDVVKVRDQLRSRFDLRALAEEVKQPYHTVYQYVRAQQLELQRCGERDYVVPDHTAQQLRAHYARQAALHQRAVPLSVAAATLGTSVDIVKQLLEDGGLTEDERAHDNRRMVTRDSVEALMVAHARRGAPPRERQVELVKWQEARALARLSDAQMDALVAAGTLSQETHGRRRHVTATSLLHHLVDQYPDWVLEALREVQ